MKASCRETDFRTHKKKRKRSGNRRHFVTERQKSKRFSSTSSGFTILEPGKGVQGNLRKSQDPEQK